MLRFALFRPLILCHGLECLHILSPKSKPSALGTRFHWDRILDQSAKWLRGLDLNQRPLGYEPNELPGCSTPHLQFSNTANEGSMREAEQLGL